MPKLTRRDALKTIGLGAGLCAGGGLFTSLFGWDPPGGQGGKRPNIIVMMVDDMGFSDVGCYGGEVRTPHLDALAAGGVRFNRFYNTSRCCPSRACILTGLYPHQTGLGHFGTGGKPNPEDPGYQGGMHRPHVTMAEILGPAGYATGQVGKWHIGPGGPKDKGFEYAEIGSSAGAGYWHYFGKQYGPTMYCTDWLGDRMVEHIDTSHQAGRPFFAYWAPNAPHWPIDAKTADIARYEGVYDKGPQAIAEERVARMRELGILEKDMPWKPPLAIGELPELSSVKKHSPEYHALKAARRRRPKDLTYKGRIMTEVEFNAGEKPRPAMSFEENMMAFAAQVDCMDQNVGKVVAKLQELGQLENTLILFCSDNGASNESHWGTPKSTGNMWAQVSNTPFRRYKKSSFDGGVGTPLIMHWPAAIAAEARGTVNDSVGHLVDIMPTVLAASGTAYPAASPRGGDLPALTGRSLLPALGGERVALEEPVFIEHSGNCALVDEDWKLVADDRKNEGPWSLYDMQRDRCELTDVAGKHPDVVERMDRRWHTIAERIGAKRTGKYRPKRKRQRR